MNNSQQLADEATPIFTRSYPYQFLTPGAFWFLFSYLPVRHMKYWSAELLLCPTCVVCNFFFLFSDKFSWKMKTHKQVCFQDKMMKLCKQLTNVIISTFQKTGHLKPLLWPCRPNFSKMSILGNFLSKMPIISKRKSAKWNKLILIEMLNLHQCIGIVIWDELHVTERKESLF